ncbi:hypothetical protein C8F01DRAFT_1137611 [Mycena amicta]|nr:hypothetical protein C8F01DRAFT_1137611 [Mycena amicta]
MKDGDAPKRAESLWFSDGSIVLQAGNTQYKVFHGILSVRSPIFRDMLAMPQPQADRELVEGCPLVHIPDDEADTTAFLNAIFHPSSFPSFPNLTDIRTILACVGLAHKYEVDGLYRRALVHLSSGHFTTLDDWLGTRPSLPTPELASPQSSWDALLDSDQFLPIIQTARTVNALWLLPNAFLRVSDSIALSLAQNASILDGKASILDEKFWLGHDKMTKALITAALGSFSTNPIDVVGCTKPARCIRGRLSSTNMLKEALAIGEVSLLALLAVLGDVMAGTGTFCPACTTSLQVHHRSTLEEFWNRLPGFYGLPSWPELETMKAEALGPNMFC